MKAPELIISKWLNSTENLTLEKLKGKVIAIHAFQMLCPGCVIHGIPQAQRLFDTFNGENVAILGLHSVFEHHEAMEEKSLRAFLHEFRIGFPVGIDEPSSHMIPKTMNLYQLRGTPTWLLIDRNGILQANIFGQIDDVSLSVEVTRLIFENTDNKTSINIFKKGRLA